MSLSLPLAELQPRLDSLLTRRRTAAKQQAAQEPPSSDDMALAPALAASASAQLAMPLEEQEPERLQASLHCLAALAALPGGIRACLDAGCVVCAGRAAAPARPGPVQR